jgi:hypothetical protein
MSSWRHVQASIVVGLSVLAAGTVGLAAPAVADTKPPLVSTPTTVSTDVLPTVQLNGVAWTQLVVGDTVFVGGSFSRAQPAGAASGVGVVVRSNMLAYDLATGVLRSGFAPAVNGEVRSLAASSDGTVVYAGGSFTSVNGSTRNRVVALNATNGSVVTGFAPSANGTVYALARSGSALYLGGAFTSISGTARGRAAAVSTAGGALTAWSPSIADGAVRGITANSALGKVALVGSFSTVNAGGTSYRGSGLVDSTAGRTNSPWRVGSVIADYGPDASLLSVSSDGAAIYATGYDFGATNGSNFEGTFAASWVDGTIRWIEDCHGDTYSNAPFNGAVYIAGHPHNCATVGGFPQSDPQTWHRGLAFSTATTGTLRTNGQNGYADFGGRPSPSLLTWFPDFNNGTYTGQYQGPWSVATGSNYVVYGGEFTTVNGVRQQGLARFAMPSIAPNRDGPRLGSASLTPTLVASGSSVQVSWKSSWDRDNQQLTYRVYRGSALIATQAGLSTFWKLPTLSFSDVGRSGAVSYHVTAADPWGNTVTGSTASIIVPAVTPARGAASAGSGPASSSSVSTRDSSPSSIVDDPPAVVIPTPAHADAALTPPEETPIGR